MFVSAQQVQLGISNFAENEIAKKAVGLNKFMVYFAMPIINKKVMQYVDTYSNDPLMQEMFDSNKNIDIDTVYNMAKTAVQKSGQFTMYGIIFNENDIDKLYSYIKGEIS
jgi:allophanate hydrolase subunit 1